ncbi:hypothetical protein BO71DRAFT_403624, partial [Aspergillus ellipticus CBS 707.79]
MMTAIREGIEGYGGLQGWQWVFIIGSPGSRDHSLGNKGAGRLRVELKLSMSRGLSARPGA